MSNKNFINPTKVITGPETRWSYANVWDGLRKLTWYRHRKCGLYIILLGNCKMFPIFLKKNLRN